MIPNKSTQIFFVVSCFFVINVVANNNMPYEDPLVSAAADGNLDRVEMYLELEPERNIINQAFLAAAENGHAGIVKVLLEKGAVPNVIDAHGMTALMRAAQEGHLLVLQVLLGVNVETDLANDHGETALLLAVRKGHFDMVNELIQAGANVNHASLTGATPLIIAAKNNHNALVELLCNAGAAVPSAQVMSGLSVSARALIERNCTWTGRLRSQWETWKSFIGSPFAPQQEEDTSEEPIFSEEELETVPVSGIAQSLSVLHLDASERDPRAITKAFRRLALQHHPDKGGDAEEFKKINNAYDYLKKVLKF